MRFLAVSTLLLALAAGIFAADEIPTFAKHWQTSGEFTVAVAEAMPARAALGQEPQRARNLRVGKQLSGQLHDAIHTVLLDQRLAHF